MGTLRTRMKGWTMAGVALCWLLNSSPSQALEKLTILMPEPHGFTFRSLYVGIEKGWFAEGGLELAFEPIPGGAVNMVPQLVQGVGDLAYAGGYTIIQARSKGAPVVGLGAASRESLFGFISSKKANIIRPQDLRGKTIGVMAFASATYFIAEAILRAGGLTKADVDIRPIGLSGPALLSQGQIDGYVGFSTQGLALQVRDFPVNVMVLDPIIALPQDLMLATEQTIASRAEALRRFSAVLKRATDYDFDPAHWDENSNYQRKWAAESLQNVAYTKAYLQFSHDRGVRDRKGGEQWGSIQASRLDAAQKFLLEIGVIDKPTPVSAMFTNEFLP